MRIEHELLIPATPDTVWELTEDVQSWPTFTPTMTDIELLDPPPLTVGTRARIRQPSQPQRTWAVTALEPGRYFAWSTNAMGMTMTGSHLIEAAEDGTKQTLAVELTGRLAPILGRLLRRPIERSLAQENAGFAAAASARAS